MVDALAGLSVRGRLLGPSAAGAPCGGGGAPPAGGGEQVCHRFRDFGKYSRGYSCRFVHGPAATSQVPTSLSGTRSSSKQIAIHDRHGTLASTGPGVNGNAQAMKIFNVLGVIDKLTEVKRRALTHRALLVPAELHDCLTELVRVLSSTAICKASKMGVEVRKALIQGIISTLERV